MTSKLHLGLEDHLLGQLKLSFPSVSFGFLRFSSVSLGPLNCIGQDALLIPIYLESTIRCSGQELRA